MQPLRSLGVAARTRMVAVCGTRKRSTIICRDDHEYGHFSFASRPRNNPRNRSARGRHASLDRLSPRRYRLLLLFLSAVAVTLASEGMQRLAALRANYYLAADRAGAVSSLPYGARLPALSAAAAAPVPVRAACGNGRVAPVTGAARTELARARWVLLDADGSVLHSGRTVPAAGDVRELAALLSAANAR